MPEKKLPITVLILVKIITYADHSIFYISDRNRKDRDRCVLQNDGIAAAILTYALNRY